MKKVFIGIALLALVMIVPIGTMAQVNISVNIGLPPPIVFPEPPVVVVLPDTYYVYVVPGIEVDLFFWNGWWWRPWQGRWYRSRYYDRGWVYYDHVPRFYFDVDPGWRAYYRDHDWHGHHWYYERIDYRRLQRNWQTWKTNRHWDREQTWGVQDYRPRPQQERQVLRQERQHEYQQRPEVQQHQQQRQQQQRQPQAQRPQAPPQRQPQAQQPKPQPHERVEQPKPQPHERVEQPQREEHGPQGEQPHGSQPHGKPEGAGGGHKK